MNQWDREFEDKPGFFDTPKGPIIVVGGVLVLGVVFLLLRSLGSSEPETPVATDDVQTDMAQPEAVVEPKQIAPPEPVANEPETLLPPVAIPEESNVVEWTVTAEEIPEDKPPPLLNASHLRGIQPKLSPKLFAVDPSLKVAVLANGPAVEIWDLGAKKRTGQVDLPGENALAVAAPSAERIIVWGSESGLMAFDQSGKPDRRLPIPATVQSGSKPACGLVVSPGGKFLALVRNGIRLYDTTEFQFSGFIPTPDDQQVLSLCYHPLGSQLLVVYDTHDHLQYRLAIFDLATGQETATSRPFRSGKLRHPAVTGPITIRRNEQNRLYLCLGGRAVLSEEDGRLLWFNQRPPAFAVMLDQGQLWTATGGKAEMSQMDWGRMEGLVRKFHFNREVSQVNPEITAQVKLEVGSLAGNSKAQVTRKLNDYLTGVLKAHGIKTSGSADATLIVRYSEKTGGNLAALRVREADGSENSKRVNGKVTQPQVEVLWHHDDLDTELWKRKLRIDASEVVCTPAQAAGDPTAGFAAAVLDLALAELGEVGIPYFVVKSLVGSKNDELPLVSTRLR